MTVGGKLDITINEAQLVRIFDSLKPNQDVFVQLICGYTDGREKVVGRTDICKNGNLHPTWNAQFLCGRDSERGSRTLKFRVHIDHQIRSPVLCGEAEFSLDNLWSRAAAGPQKVPVPLFKRGEQTGMLNITIGLQSFQTSFSGPTPVHGCLEPPLTPSPASAGTDYVRPAAPRGLGAPQLAAADGSPLDRTPASTPAGEDGWRVPPPRLPVDAARRLKFTAELQNHADAAQSSARTAVQPHPAAQLPAAAPPVLAEQCVSPGCQQRAAAQLARARVEPQPAPALQCLGAQEARMQLPVAHAVSYPATTSTGELHAGGGVYATGASGQWWNSFIDRG
mmetsp:Transcript_102172/g.284538  ORF Transcript_102172/g.284538 Transcript_102172/m.284538 type:complete len:337 (-) Transcript_102172:121-1131(-)